MHVNCTLGSSSFVWFFTWWSYCKILYFSHVARIQDFSTDLVREKVEALFFYTSKHVNQLFFFFFFFPIKNLFLNFANIIGMQSKNLQGHPCCEIVNSKGIISLLFTVFIISQSSIMSFVCNPFILSPLQH